MKEATRTGFFNWVLKTYFMEHIYILLIPKGAMYSWVNKYLKMMAYLMFYLKEKHNSEDSRITLFPLMFYLLKKTVDSNLR